MTKNSLLLFSILILQSSLFSSSYTDFKKSIEEEENKEVPQEILDYREYTIENMKKRFEGLDLYKPGFKSANKEYYDKSIKCINKKETIEDINKCVPKLLKNI